MPTSECWTQTTYRQQILFQLIYQGRQREAFWRIVLHLLLISNIYSVVPHSAYNPSPPNKDVVLFKLQRKVDFSALPNVYPACWPTLQPTGAGTIVRILPCHSVIFFKRTQSSNVTMISGNCVWIWDNIWGWIYFSYPEKGGLFKRTPIFKKELLYFVMIKMII